MPDSPKREPLWSQAKCKGLGTKLFFDEDSVEEAKEYCSDCPIKRLCNEWAKDNEEVGVWGGEARGT